MNSFNPIWKLWLDDLCEEPGSGRLTPEGWLGAKCVSEAMRLVNEHGSPILMSLDHDLGDQTTMDFLKSWTKKYTNIPFPEYRIHSANPIGALNIKAFIDSWNKSLM